MLESGLGAEIEESAKKRQEGAVLPPSFGDYELVEEIARGGMGIVYKARQISLNRMVAVKMILAGRLANKADVQRFRAEAETAARLQHPNIVAIHEVGEQNGQPFFSMDYVEGKSLAEIARNEPLPPKRAAKYLQIMAEAIQCAHSKGVLHRDLKPSNILIDHDNHLHITDFGLAKRLDGSALASPACELTLTGQVLGSPNFMPPEQASGDRKSASAASDVYSLGAILYYLLTGRPPFLAETLTQTLRLVAETDPTPLRLLNPAVPVDLETICLKCLEKDQQRRYGSAQDLAQELGRFLRNQPILARPAAPFEKFQRWCGRHPAVAGLSTMVVALLITVAVSAILYASRLKAANQRATEKLWEAYLGQARAERWSGLAGRRARGLELLTKAAAIRPTIELRNEAIACLALEDFRRAKDWRVPEGARFRFDRSYQRYAIADKQGRIAVRRTSDDQELAIFPTEELAAHEMDFSLDGRFMFAHSREPTKLLHIYDLHQKKWLLTSTNSQWIRGALFNPDSKKIFVITALEHTSEVSVLSLPDGSHKRLFTNEFLPFGVAISPDHDRLAISSQERPTVEIRDAISGDFLYPLLHPSFVVGVEWDRSGALLATCCGDRNIYVWDMRTLRQRAVFTGHDAKVLWAVFSPDGHRLASSSWDATCRLWDVDRAREILTMPCFDGIDRFSSDGRWISVLLPNMVQLYEAEGRREWRALELEPSRWPGAWQCAWSPDGRVLASAHRDGVRLWDVATGREFNLPQPDGTEPSGVLFAPLGAELLVAAAGGIRQWPVEWETGHSVNEFLVGTEHKVGPNLTPGSLSINATGNRVTMVANGSVQVFQYPSWRPIRTLTSEAGASWCVSSPSGRFCIGMPWAGDAPRCVWELDTGRVLTNLPASGIYGAAFTPDDNLLITGSGYEYIAWDLHSWAVRWKLPRRDPPGPHARLALNRDGKLGAMTVTAKEILLFEPSTGRPLATLEAPTPKILSWLAFSPDGTQLAGTTQTSVIHVWDLRQIRQELTLRKLDWEAPAFPPAVPLSTIPIKFVATAPTTTSP